MTDGAASVQVRLRGVPLRIRTRAVEHEQDLLRELALVRMSADNDGISTAPGRLLDIADEVRTTYGAVAAGPNAEMEAAVDRGEEAIDVVYTVPVQIREFLRRAAQVLEEAEQFCREGKYLLTLASPPDVAAYRQWVFEEFDRQIGGGPAVPWHESTQARTVMADG